MTEDRFWKSNPRIIKAYEKAHIIKLEKLDEIIWACCGTYVLPAVRSAVDQCLNGRKSKAEYTKEPIYKKSMGKYEFDMLSEEEQLEIKRKEFAKKMENMRLNFQKRHTMDDER